MSVLPNVLQPYFVNSFIYVAQQYSWEVEDKLQKTSWPTGKRNTSPKSTSATPGDNWHSEETHFLRL